MKKVLLSIMLIAGVCGLTFGQQGSTSKSKSQGTNENWVKIGEKSVDLSQDHGIFNWNTDREKSINANDRYSEIKFKAIDAPVSLTNVEVVYDNGKKSDLSINSPIAVNNESKPVMLDSKAKLDKITFNYSKNASSTDNKAKIELWGLKSGASTGMGSRDQSKSGTHKSTTKTTKTTTNTSNNPKK